MVESFVIAAADFTRTLRGQILIFAKVQESRSDPMKFVMTPVGSAGDVHPFIGLGRALRARGHDVVIVTAGTFEQVVQRAGLEFRETISAQFFDVMSKHPDLWHSRRGLQFVLGTVADYLQ